MKSYPEFDRRRALVALASLSAAPMLSAQTAYPRQTIRFVVPVTPGGTTDILTRMLAQGLQEALGQSVVVDNKPGAGGIIAMENAARSAPDGHTIAMSYIGVAAVNPWLYKNLPYDPLRDFVTVSLVARFPTVLVVHPSFPADSIEQFIDQLKRKPGELNYASAGTASMAHLAMELFLRETGTRMAHVPYKGSAPAMNDLLAGRVVAAFDTLTAVWPHVQAGKIKALGIASRERAALAPQIPTIGSTVANFEATGWYGVLAPTGTPPEIVARLDQGFKKIVSDPAMRDQFAKRGLDADHMGASDFGRFLRDENEKWRRVVQEAGIRVE